MTITQAACELNRSEMTLRRWIKSGKINATWSDYGRRLEISDKEIKRIKAMVKNQKSAEV